MTIARFLERLKETKGPWEVGPTGALRCGDNCPITAIASEAHPDLIVNADDAWLVADGLGLSDRDADAIIFAADDERGVDGRLLHDPYLRRSLLAVTVHRS